MTTIRIVNRSGLWSVAKMRGGRIIARWNHVGQNWMPRHGGTHSDSREWAVTTAKALRKAEA